MNAKALQKKIDAIDYWDCEVMDFSINYFGDEVNIVISGENDYKVNNRERQTGYRIKFRLCYQVEYKTDAKDEVWRKNIEVKNMDRCQLGHYAQEITVRESEVDGFVEVKLNTGLLFAKIICKDIVIEKGEYIKEDFFWSKKSELKK